MRAALCGHGHSFNARLYGSRREYNSVPRHSSVADPQSMETQGKDRPEVQERANAMQGAEGLVKSLHLVGNLKSV